MNGNPSLEEIFNKYKLPIIFVLIAFLFLGLAIFIIKGDWLNTSPKVEVLSSTDNPTNNTNEIIVEIAGAVQKPGVYRLPTSSRIEDLLIAAGGLSENADRVWIDKTINKAAKLVDGQKIYIKQLGETSASNLPLSDSVAQYNNGQININTASASELDKLSGIGPVYAQKIIDQRPYSNISELVSKKVISQSIYEKIKDKITAH